MNFNIATLPGDGIGPEIVDQAIKVLTAIGEKYNHTFTFTNALVGAAAIDATGMCLFIAFAILDQEETFQAMIDMINAFHGLNLTADDVTELGKKILRMERDFNERAGFTPKDDRLPEFFNKEPFPPHDVTFGVTDEELDSVYNF